MARRMDIARIAALLTAAAWPAFAQNLITNPGFESGLTGWATIWSRTAGAATATAVSSPVHGGASAVRITHNGTEDWSFQPSTGFPLAVRPGLVYEYSAWVRVDTLAPGGNAQLSLVLRNGSGTVLDWSYAERSCSLSTGGYSQYVTRFMVPDSVATIVPRLIGYGACRLYADDFSLALVDSLPSSLTRPYVLQNGTIRVSMSPVSFIFDIRRLPAGRSWVTGPTGLFQPRSVDSTADSLVFHCTFVRDNWPVDITVALEGPAVRITMHADSARPLSEEFVFPGPIVSGDNEHIVIGKGTGIIMPVRNVPQYLNDYRWHSFSQWQCDMSLVGVTDMTAGYALATADPWFTRAQMYPAAGSSNNAPHIVHEPAKRLFGKPDRTVYLAAFETGGYVAMAQWYRAVAEKHGWVKTFGQKAAQTPNIELLKGAVDWWNVGRGFWNSRATFYRDLRDYGIDRAIVNGGCSDALVDTLNTMGYLTSVYDIYCDAYPPGHAGYWSDGYEVDAIVNEDGSYMNGWLAYLDSGQTLQAQEVCATAHVKYAIPRIDAERTHRRLNTRFIDVELAIGLQNCWSPVHPVNRWSDARCRVKLFDTLRTRYGLVLGGEQARDFAFPYVDYGEGTMSFSPVEDAGYDWATPEPPDSGFVSVNMNPAIHVPLHGLAYHDVHMPTWYTGDGVSKVPAYWDDKDLFNILYASMPLFMPPDTGYWRTNFEKFLTSYHLVSAVNRGVGFAKMTDHAFLNASRNAQRTRFENGWTVTVNFDPAAQFADGARTLPPKGFYASGPGGEAGRVMAGADRVSWARLADRLFVNSYGTAVATGGVRSTGAVFLRRDTAAIHLAFIGPQQSVEFNPAELPWPMAGVSVFARTGQQMTLADAGGGWLRLTRLAATPFYRIEGAFAARGLAPAMRRAAFRVRPRPDAGAIAISLLAERGEVVTLELASLSGQVIVRKVLRASRAGRTGVTLDAARVPPGVYVVRAGMSKGVVTARLVWPR